MDILTALRDKHIFAPHFPGDSWAAWKGFLASLFALPMSDADLALYRQCTGRTIPPSKAFGECAVIAGRRAGKSRILALIAVYIACFRDYRQYLAPGEKCTIAIIASNRSQARSIFRFTIGLLKAVPLIDPMVIDWNTESIELSNRVVIEIQTASFRVTRGYSFGAVLLDEIAFFRQDETSAAPDVEILRALRPGMSTIPGSVLIMASSPYARKGELYNAYRRYWGKDDARVLCWKAATSAMNPKVDQAVIQAAYESDPQAADAEFGANFRSDIADFITREAVDAATMWGRHELPPCPGIAHQAFIDPSGGLQDSMTCAIAHLGDGVCVLDHLTEIKSPFSPEQAVLEITDVLRRFGVTRAVSDKYGGDWVKARFAEHGILLETNAEPKSSIYLSLLAMINSGRVELLENSRLASQLCSLERRTSRQGRDVVDHGPGAHDDLINAAAGALVAVELDRRPALVRQESMLDAGEPVRIPEVIATFVAVLCIDKLGMCASVRAAATLYGTIRLIILDFDAGPLHHGALDGLTNFAQFECRCRNGTIAVVPEGFAPNQEFNGVRAIEIIDGRLPELQLLAAARMIDRGAVKLGPLAEEKAKSLPFGGALNFRAGENIEDPLRCAILTTIAVSLESDTSALKVG